MKNYLSLVKFSHSIFAMPFALLGFVLALKEEQLTFSLLAFLLVIACMVFARNVAMAFNRLVDATIDKQNPRTANREIPQGIINKNSALIFVIVNAFAFLCSTFFINKLCFYLSPIALFIIMIYSYMKRFSPLCHIVLGLGLALAPIGAFIAITAYIKCYIIILGICVMLWVSGFDIIYALQDEAFDKKMNLKSIPVLLGIYNARILAITLHCFCGALFLFLILNLHLGVLSLIAYIFFTFFLIRQHFIIDLKNLHKIDGSFFTNNGIASVLFCSLVIIDLLFFKA